MALALEVPVVAALSGPLHRWHLSASEHLAAAGVGALRLARAKQGRWSRGGGQGDVVATDLGVQWLLAASIAMGSHWQVRA